MPQRTVISGGVIVSDNDQFRADIVIDDERIAALVADAHGIDADEHIDATDLLILPGVIDGRTSFQDPASQTAEGMTSGGLASAAGGTTTVVELPHAVPPVRDLNALGQKTQRIRQAAIVDTALWAGISSDDLRGRDEIRGLVDRGVAGFVATMANVTPDVAALDEADLLGAMLGLARLDLPLALHAEHEALLRASLAEFEQRGRTDPRALAESRPPLIEAAAVNAALFLAERTGCWVHICHVSTAESLRLISDARARGTRVTVDISIHLLALTSDDLRSLRGFGASAPPLRSSEEVEELWSYLHDETIDFVCSDHVATPIAAKRAGDRDIFAAPLGVTGAQTLLPVFWHEAVTKRRMNPSQVVRLLASNPAQIFGFHPRKGTIRVGADADLALLDPQSEWTIRNADMLYQHPWTPFDGRTVTGLPVRTIRRGETIYDAERHGRDDVAVPGNGRFIPRGYGSNGRA